MGFEPNLNPVRRYSRTFNSLSTTPYVAPFFFMAANTTGVAGDVLQYSTEDTVAIGVSGLLKQNFAGFLMQDVKDLDAGPVKGYRNYQNTVENLGGNVGVLQGGGPAETKRYVGTPAVGTRLASAKDGGGRLEAYSATANQGDPIAIVEAIVSDATPTVEPQQFTSAVSPDWIRIRIYNQ